MCNIDIARIRKMAGMSQRELAEKLSVKPSFLSAIENGRSRMPEEKLEKIKEIFDIDDLSRYMKEPEDEPAIVPPHTHAHDESDVISSFLHLFHDRAHHKDGDIHAREAELEERIKYLGSRNDRLSDRVDDLREEVDRLRAENFRLKELLMKHSVGF